MGEGAIKAGDAYVEMTLDKSKLDKGIEDVGKGGAKALTPIKDRLTQLQSSLWRMTGAIAIIRISAAAIEGAFSQMAAERSMEKALAKGDIVAATAEMRKAEIAQEGWLRNLPLIGGYIGGMFDAFKDRSLEEFAAQIAAADEKGRGFAATLDVLRTAELALAKARGETPAQLAMRGAIGVEEKATVALGAARAAYAARRAEQDAAKAKVEELGQSKLAGIGITTEEASQKGRGWHVGGALLNPLAGALVLRKEKQLAVAKGDLAKAIQNTNESRGKVAHLEQAGLDQGQTAAIEAAGGLSSAALTGQISGSELAGAAPGNVAWGMPAAVEETAADKLLEVQQGQSGTLEGIKSAMDNMAKEMAKVAANTTPPPPPAYHTQGIQ